MERMEYERVKEEVNYPDYPVYTLFIGEKNYATVEWNCKKNTFVLESYRDMTQDELIEVMEIIRVIRKENNP